MNDYDDNNIAIDNKIEVDQPLRIVISYDVFKRLGNIVPFDKDKGGTMIYWCGIKWWVVSEPIFAEIEKDREPLIALTLEPVLVTDRLRAENYPI